MRTDILSSDNMATRPRSSQIPSVVFALAVSAGAIYAAAHGPTLWRAAQEVKAEQIKQEDRMFCKNFNMPPDSESFATCVGYLSEIRRLHGDRLAAEAAGVF
jgi:hypothetical protein